MQFELDDVASPTAGVEALFGDIYLNPKLSGKRIGALVRLYAATGKEGAFKEAMNDPGGSQSEALYFYRTFHEGVK